ncbi:hypothetical protein DFJ73DRAFT_813744 [Zopfochytrium polystomum]|nr:hypothetical protein DFJ73DRAFT_813744 [Zopfochytrium polystomum]
MWAMESIVKSGVPKENKDNLTVVVVMSAESERLATISRIKTLLRAVYQSTTADVNLSIRAVVGFGSQVGPLICSLVDEHRPDMLVLGSAGKTHVEGFLVGSVSQYCISHANCPVVVARLTPADERGRDLRTGAKLRKRSVSPYIHV